MLCLFFKKTVSYHYKTTIKEIRVFKADFRLVVTLKLPNQDDKISKALLATFS